MGKRLKIAGISIISLLLILCFAAKQSASYASLLKYDDQEYIGKGIEGAEALLRRI